MELVEVIYNNIVTSYLANYISIDYERHHIAIYVRNNLFFDAIHTGTSIYVYTYIDEVNYFISLLMLVAM